MNDNDKRTFDEMLCAIFSMYNKPPPSPELVKMYFSALAEYTIEEIREGLNRHAVDTDQGQYIPKPADIVRNVKGNSESRAETAWGKVDKAIRTVGPHQDVCFDDGLIHSVIVDMGGWIELNKVTMDEYPFKHNEFVKRYRGYITRPPKQIMSHLTGTANGHNRGVGEILPPMLIGDKQKAAEILHHGVPKKPQVVHMADSIAAGLLEKLQ